MWVLDHFLIVFCLFTTYRSFIVYIYNLRFNSWPFIIELISCICPSGIFLSPQAFLSLSPYLLFCFALHLHSSIMIFPIFQQFSSVICCFNRYTTYVPLSYWNRLLRNYLNQYKCQNTCPKYFGMMYNLDRTYYIMQCNNSLVFMFTFSDPSESQDWSPDHDWARRSVLAPH